MTSRSSSPWRGLLALGCCVFYVVFGVAAGTAHLHGSSDHHAESRGMHFGHDHLGEAERHGHDHGHHHHHDHGHGSGAPDRGDADLDARHPGHHHGDAFYLSAAAVRGSDSKPRPLPVGIFVGPVVDTPSMEQCGLDMGDRAPEGRRHRGRARPRAPPA